MYSLQPTILMTKWAQFRSSFWFLPLCLNVCAVILGLLIPYLESRYQFGQYESFEWMLSTARSAQGILAALAGALITEPTMIFSVTMVTLTLTTSQYGSQPLRAFIKRSFSQLTLGMFLGTSIFCLLVLYWVRDSDTITFVPHISVTLALFMTIVDHGLFIYFLHQVATSIQSNVVAKSVADDLRGTIDRVFPTIVGQPPKEDHKEKQAILQTLSRSPYQSTIRSSFEGYLQFFDHESVMEMAREANVVISLKIRPGDFLIDDSPLAVVYSPEEFDKESIASKFNNSIITGSRRTPDQDVESAIWELVEVAVRALSPGINDPVTALICIDYLGANLKRLMGRIPIEEQRFDKDGHLRLIIPTITFEEAMQVAHDQIRLYGATNNAILMRQLTYLQQMHQECDRDEYFDVIERHINQIVSTAETSLEQQFEIEAVKRLAKIVPRKVTNPV